MKKIFSDAPDVPLATANAVARIIERHLRIHRVDRAKDLPEEAKVRLYRDIRAFFDDVTRLRAVSRSRQPGALRRIIGDIRQILRDCLTL